MLYLIYNIFFIKMFAYGVGFDIQNFANNCQLQFSILLIENNIFDFEISSFSIFEKVFSLNNSFSFFLIFLLCVFKNFVFVIYFNILVIQCYLIFQKKNYFFNKFLIINNFIFFNEFLIINNIVLHNEFVFNTT